MNDRPTTEGSRFVVDLGSVKLPPIVEKQVETDIRAVVLKALADEPFAARTALPPWIFNHFPGRTLGLWMDPDAHIPWEPTGPLDPTDHTLIVGQVMQYPLQVVRSLGVTPGQAPPTDREVLEAMLDVPEIDPTAKARIRLALEVLSQIEPTMAKPSREVKRAQNLVSDLLSEGTIFEQVRALREAAMRPPDPSPDWLKELLEWIARMLEDGASTIYSRDHAFYRLLASGGSGGSGTISKDRDAIDTIKDLDALGATAGAGIGAAGVATIPVGAAAIASAASAGAAIGCFLAWLF
jgi:hypothetical protein